MDSVRSKVVLLGYSQTAIGGGPEELVAAAGKLCYSKVGAEEISKKMTDEEIKKFICMLSNMGHYSPFEHANFTFAIEGISRTCSHQLVRHRIASYSQQSQRYVDLESTFEVIVPPEIDGCNEAKEVYVDSIKRDYDAYVKITKLLKYNYVADGMDNRNASKKALEDARFALPNACETKIVMSMNARSLINFFKERCCNRAQWEIRNVAYQMLDLVLDVAPNLFSKAGAPCSFGRCPEGSMSCGNVQEPLDKQKVLK